MLVAGLSPRPWRGSDEIVTGIPSRVALGRLLHPVVPLGERDGPGCPVDVEVGQAHFRDQSLCRDRREPFGFLADGAVVGHEQALMEELCGLLLERHAGEEVGDPILDR